MARHSFCYILLFCLAASSLSAGCSLFRDEEKIARQKEEIQHKKDLYAKLTRDAGDGTLKEGMTSQHIRDSYGEPVDIFRSGSSTSPMEVWTYEKVLEPGEEDWSPVRLYLDRGKLITWKY